MMKEGIQGPNKQVGSTEQLSVFSSSGDFDMA